MDAYDTRKTVYLIVAAMAACLLSFAGPKCRRDRADRGTDAPHSPGRGADPDDKTQWIVFKGTSDASAAVALADGTLLVADDENNILRVYRNDGGSPVVKFDLTGPLGLAGKNPEADIEGAARIGDRIYWITSHGRNRNGKWRPNRCRFFATDVNVSPERTSIHHAGSAYSKLAEQMMADPTVRAACPGLPESFHSGKISGSAKQLLAPKERGLNIEGLCASGDRKRLYIGLRNPLGGSRAIVVPLLNPREIVGGAELPSFGRPMLWDLGGAGIRDMAYSTRLGVTFILAGPKGDSGSFALYRWSGQPDEQPVLVKKLKSHKPTWRPEAVVEIPDSPDLLIISDDGVVLVPVAGPDDCIKPEYYRRDGTSLNKHLIDETKKYFRARRISAAP